MAKDNSKVTLFSQKRRRLDWKQPFFSKTSSTPKVRKETLFSGLFWTRMGTNNIPSDPPPPPAQFEQPISQRAFLHPYIKDTDSM